MADTTPLLPQSTPQLPSPPSLDPEAPPHLTKLPTAAASLDDTLDRCIGGIGCAQLFQAILAAFAWVFDAQQTFISVFTDVHPTWHCTDSGDVVCSSAHKPCGLPSGSWAWDRPAHTSVVSEWSLECYSSSISGIPASAFFIGCLVGGLVLATLADSSLGRKKMLWTMCLAMSVTGILTTLSPNVWVYTGFKFVNGFARATIGTSALVLSTEITGKRWRNKVSILGFFLFTVGFLSLPAMAYAGRELSWRTLYLWTSAPAMVYSIMVCFFVRESPRWLLVRGRREEAIQTLKGMAKSNGYTVQQSFSCLAIFEEEAGGGGAVDLYSALMMLVESKWASRRLVAVMVVGFGVGMVYYGMPLGVGNLGFNLYLSVTLNAMAELPSSLMAVFLIDVLNRRTTILAFTVASGVGSLACVALKGNVVARLAAETASFFSACTAFNILLVYALELFPTCVRNSAVSMVRQALVLGGVVAPVLVAVGTGREFLSFGVFGLAIGCCGLFVVCLPETRGRGMCDTMEEQEHKEDP